MLFRSAATVCMLNGRQLPSEVVCSVSDCAYTSVWAEFAHQLHRYIHLPVFPFLYLGQLWAKLFARYDWKDADCIAAVRNATKPMLFIHGEEDTYVPYVMLNPLFLAAACPKHKVSVPEAKHATSVLTNEELYWREVFAFIAQYVPQS